MKIDQVQLSRPYYDRQRDLSEVEKYYKPMAGVTAPGAFFIKLHQLLEKTHKHELAYDPSRYLYDWVDLHPDLRLRSIYSGELTDQAREWGQALAQGPTDALAIARHIVEIETREALNCEHAVPRIWFEDAQPMRGDLHHLFTCDAETNLLRSDFRYFDFPDTEHTRTDGQDCFEPASGRGPVARAVLYFLVRYPHRTRLGTDDVDMLLRWHREDPPGLYEKHRNQAIFGRQGNRNPFIDHPQWAERVDFSMAV